MTTMKLTTTIGMLALCAAAVVSCDRGATPERTATPATSGGKPEAPAAKQEPAPAQERLTPAEMEKWNSISDQNDAKSEPKTSKRDRMRLALHYQALLENGMICFGIIPA